MATLGSSVPASPPRPTRKSCARKCERCCCTTIIYFPLVFVYGLTTWATWVQANIGLLPEPRAWTGRSSALAGIVLYILLNWSYTTAVFTDPGSFSRRYGTNEVLPTQEPPTHASLTTKYNGQMRYCKKCQARKPDRAHHCSTCRRCVLQMDHHCPWLATCVGFRNRKAFILFLIYTCLFCWMAFASSATWVWAEFVTEGFHDQLMPINYILLAVIAGIIGLVLTGFTGWHIWLGLSGQTTIESLEKTRYLTPLRKSMQQQYQRNYVGDDGPTIGQQLREIHANAIPGVTRPEEGEERSSPARESLRLNYAEAEYQRERERYDAYLDEQASEKLPNAFDLGWRRNLLQLFGERPLLWALPICNSTGDGWHWDSSPKWHEAQQRLLREREARVREQEAFDRDRAATRQMGANVDVRGNQYPLHDSQFARTPGSHYSMNTMGAARSPTQPRDEDYESSSDDEDGNLDERSKFLKPRIASTPTSNWNDVPAELLERTPKGGPRVPSRQRRREEPG